MSAPTTPRPATAPPPQAPAPAARTTEFVRIGLAGPAGRADLAVPAAVPLARLLPTLLRHAGGEPEADGGVRHGGWILRRDDGSALDAADSLTAQGVREGDLLFLGHGHDDTTPPLYDDVVEVIGDHGVRGPWPPAATRRTAAGLAVVAAVAGCGALVVAPGRLPGWLGLATALFALAVGVLMSRAFADREAGTFAGALAAPLAVLGAVRLLGTEPGLGGLGAGHVLLACATLAVIGAVGPLLVGGGESTFSALVTAGPLGAVAPLAAVLWDAEPARGAAVAAPLALALTTVWPTLALRFARIPAPYVAASAEDLEALPSQLEHARLRARIEQARRLLLGMLLGSHLVAGAGALVLFASGGVYPTVLGAVLVVLMMLRSRLFKETRQAAVSLVTALLTLLGGAAALVLGQTGSTLALLGIALPVALVTALAAGGVAVAAGRVRVNPRLLRGLDLLETVVLVSVVPLVLAVWQVYTTLLNLKV
ncbi:type VII secretion integral membrane protein EccD [Streptomyces harbinensis]|uniref:type VII secretion integral membrane protein EccD n=1 Tax=Streptomyces harbinensis TaxID=1176198 RepID=UPI0036B7808B